MKSAAVIQMNSGAEVAVNLRQASRLLARAAAAGATLAVLPENFACMPANAAERMRAAERAGSGAIQDFLAASAARLKLWIVGGTIPIRTRGERFAAAVLVFDAEGRQVARYDKFHLFDVGVPGRRESYRESRHFRPGKRLVALDTPLGRLGLAVCYDLRFPEMFRVLTFAQHCEYFAVPSAFTAATGRVHWQLLVRSRALENQCFVLAAAQTGRHPGGRETHGESLIVGPWGESLAGLGRRPGVAAVPLDREIQARVRRRFPVLDHARWGEITGSRGAVQSLARKQ